ncbi:MAG TPA: phosphatidylglycerophosphatase A [Desulfomicrobiaceae bacterium]|nr:phosphatidylglycerophosphatase A [Desulfomicrobiaceae bacterium]
MKPSVTLRDQAVINLATLWIAGRASRAPGTWGSLASVFLALPLFLPLGTGGRLLALVVIFFAGAWAATRAEIVLGRKDPGAVVIDELLGQWVTFLPFAVLSPLELAAGFALFRLFDITKPWPVKASEKWLPAGYGIMVDDVLAGCYAGVALYGIRFVMS